MLVDNCNEKEEYLDNSEKFFSFNLKRKRGRREAMISWICVSALGIFGVHLLATFLYGPQWYEQDKFLLIMTFVFFLYAVSMAQSMHWLKKVIASVCAIGIIAVALSVCVYASYFVFSRLPVMREMAALIGAIFICAIIAGFVKQKQTKRRMREINE